MSKIFRVAIHHLGKEASSRSFLIILFSLPLFLVLVLGLGYLSAFLMQKTFRIGYVDKAQIISEIPDTTNEERVILVQFESSELAREALDANQIDAYYILPANYLESRQSDLFYLEEIPRRGQLQFAHVVEFNLLKPYDPAVSNRIINGSDITVRSMETNRDYSSGGPEPGQVLPLVAAGVFAFLVLTSSGYMMQVMVEEKENRTMEVVITSLSPSKLMTGKIFGAVAIASVQLIIWVVFLLVGVWLGILLLDSPWLETIEPAWRDVFLVILVAIPDYLMITAVTTVIGATLVDSQEAQQVGPLIFFVLLVPIYLFLPIVLNPDGPLAMVFTFFPLTSVMTLAMRSMVTLVPVWQFILSALIALICAVVGIWLAGKAFRLSLVRYGQRLKIRELFGFQR